MAVLLPTEEVLTEAQRELARRRFLPFVQRVRPYYVVAPVHRFLATKLEQFEQAVRDHASPRLMIFMQPRLGKSELTSRHFPAWLLGRNPDWSVGLVSYGAELAEELSADARRVVMGDEYAAIFGQAYDPEAGSSVEIDRGSKAVNHWRIKDARGGVRAVGVGGALTGRGFEAALLDDPVKSREVADSDLERDKAWKWYQGTLRTRLEPGGGILLITTRWHHDDLAGRLLRDAPDLWDVVSLPAIAEANDPLGRRPGEALDSNRFAVEELAAIRRDIGEREWFAQYQQQPTPDEGAIFQRAWLRLEPIPLVDGFILHAWDTAFSTKQEADFSVGTVWRMEPTCYRLLDRIRVRADYPTVKDLIKRTALDPRYRAHSVLIEAIGTGQSLVQDLRNETRLPIQTYRPDRDKVSRAHAVTPLFQAGRVVFPKDAPWLEELILELCQFPHGPHDDQCFIAGTMIATPTGERPIETIRRGDRVLTPFGPRRVRVAGCTGTKPVVHAWGLTGTATHPIFDTTTMTWHPLDSSTTALVPSILSLWTLIRWQYRKQLRSLASPTDSWEDGDAITSVSRIPMQDGSVLKDCTWRFGKLLRARAFRQAAMFITKMAIHSITTATIWSVYRAGTMHRRIRSRTRNVRRNTWQRFARWQHNGISPKQATPGTASMRPFFKPQRQNVFVSSVVRHSLPDVLSLATAPMGVVGLHDWPQGSTMSNGSAPRVVLFSRRSNGDGGNVWRTHAAGVAESNLDRLDERLVYNLSVEGVPAFYANGVLVHNCDSVTSALATMGVWNPGGVQRPVLRDFAVAVR